MDALCTPAEAPLRASGPAKAARTTIVGCYSDTLAWLRDPGI